MRGSTAALMAAALLVSLAATDTSTISYEQETRRIFVEWKAKYGQTYKDVGQEECRYRRVDRANALYAGVTSYGLNSLSVDRANALYAGVTSYGLNSLSGLTKEEIFRGRGVRMGEESYEEETRRMFVGWKAMYGKTYKDVGEEECRYKLFKGNRRVVDQLNSAAGETAYGLNEFGDLTNEEVRACCYGRGGGGGPEQPGDGGKAERQVPGRRRRPAGHRRRDAEADSVPGLPVHCHGTETKYRIWR